jgi:hypothetical protein
MQETFENKCNESSSKSAIIDAIIAMRINAMRINAIIVSKTFT